jgi:DNA-binding LytR/AlgR family response regulator
MHNSRSTPVAAGRRRLFLVHPAPGVRDTIDPDEIFFVEATEDDTSVRTRRAQRIQDVRTLRELEAILGQWGFVRTHRNYLVNPDHVRQIRLRPGSRDWELKLDPPVNRVLPVSRSALAALWAAFGEE